MPEIPWGKREDQRLELKSRDALQNPEIIAREVVGMLNAEGGEVWVGLREEEGRAVAVEPISDPEGQARRLLDYLVDTIEPSPAGREVEVRVEGEILKVLVLEGQRNPYAFLKKWGRHFVVRVGDRLRPMSIDEIAQTFKRQEGTQGAREKAAERVLEARKKLQGQAEALFWLCIEPAQEIEIDLHDGALKALLRDPRLTNNRPDGWSFAGSGNWISLKQGRLLLTSSEDDPRSIEIRRNGGITFSIPLLALYWKGGEKEIWPFTLLEYPVSAFRIARSIYGAKLQPNHEIVADLALTGLSGWKLRYGSPGIWAAGPREYKESTDFFLERPLVFTGEEIDRESDRCGYRLVERVYEAFGMSRDAIPKEFDQETGRLILPE